MISLIAALMVSMVFLVVGLSATGLVQAPFFFGGLFGTLASSVGLYKKATS